jgi:glycosyltransferase involved in cell wall biosynthesis
MSKAVATVADTVLGYGSSQILALTYSLAELIGGQHQIFQPFVPQRKFIDLNKKGYCFETIATIEHPWSWIGRMQYLRRAAKLINDSRPDILILPNYNMIPIIALLDYRPKKIIHLVLEDMEQFGVNYWANHIVMKIKQLVEKIDLWIFPEQNRAIHDCKMLGIPFDRICLFYNVTTEKPLVRAASDRNGKVIYAGSVDFDRTVAHYLASPPVAAQAIDVFGNLSGSEHQKQDFLAATRASENRLRYLGEIPAETLAEQLPSYAYSLVYWFPVNWALRNAAPNKFFQAIASGVPALAAPHPQCRLLIERYGCGIVLKDWEFHTFLSGLKAATAIIGASAYQEMVEGCQVACVKELNWNNQFRKIEKLFQGVKDKP